MMCTAYFGILCEERKIQWNYPDTNPYGVLISPICLERIANDLLFEGSRYFRDKIKIDWGSFAWKCTKEEIFKFLCDHKTTLPWLVENDEEMLLEVISYLDKHKDEEFGIVFIEEY